MTESRRISSRDNPLFREFAELAHSARERRKLGRSVLEGIHLCEAFLQCRGQPRAVLASESGLRHPEVGPLLALKALMPKLDKLNPLTGLKNLIGKKQIIELVKSMAKLGVTGWVVWGVVRDAMALVVATIDGDAAMTMTVLGELVSRVVTKVTMLFIGFAIFDVWWQHKSYMKDQMMSKDDVKKEYKQSEGDPHHKAHRKQMHQEIMEGAQMEAVQGADVIVTNPDHVAVALHFEVHRFVERVAERFLWHR
jgi:flagellar biosynthesis protein FlhB